MINIPKKPIQPSILEPAEPHPAGSGISTKRRHSGRQEAALDQHETKSGQQKKKLHTAARIDDALSKPSIASNAFNRFLAHLERQDSELGTGRNFHQMMERQNINGRPLIIARCLCDKHIQDENKVQQVLHPEFMDGNIIFEALNNKRLAPEIIIGDFGGHSPTIKQRKNIEEFITKGSEFWAVNPSTKTHDTITNSSAIMNKTSALSGAVEALLSSDIKLLEEEDESDHAFAYVNAGLYHSGHVVRKDQSLAEKSVTLIRPSALPFAQATAFSLALDIHIDVFTSLLALGLDPTEVDEQGRNMIDITMSKPVNEQKLAALLVLKQRGYL